MLIRKMYIHFWLFQAFLKFLDTPTDCVNSDFTCFYTTIKQTDNTVLTRSVFRAGFVHCLPASKSTNMNELQANTSPSKHPHSVPHLTCSPPLFSSFSAPIHWFLVMCPCPNWCPCCLSERIQTHAAVCRHTTPHLTATMEAFSRTGGVLQWQSNHMAHEFLSLSLYLSFSQLTRAADVSMHLSSQKQCKRLALWGQIYAKLQSSAS